MDNKIINNNKSPQKLNDKANKIKSLDISRINS